MELKEFKELLPKGSVKEVAQMAGTTQAAVYNFLAGKSKSFKVEVAMMKVITQALKEKNEAVKALKNEMANA